MGVFEHWPNRITALRLVGSIVLFCVFAFLGEGLDESAGLMRVAFWLFVITAATDALDGYLARRDQRITAFGRIADPFVDKVLVVGSMVYLAVMDWSRPWFPAWVVVVIVAREFLVTGIRGYVESVGREFPADWFGKIKMIVQCVAIADVMFVFSHDWSPGWESFWRTLGYIAVGATVLTTVGSGLSYVLKTHKLLLGAER
jgi:CDP-diacylglycerol--glycerol-3-phosphate 3-phosphatidyltransferase